MAKAREVPDLRCEQRFGSVAGRAINIRAEELLEHSEGVLDTGAIERVHAMRVASRRLRATMEIFEPCFPRKPFRKVLREVRAIADALGERRDRDVSIAALEAFSASLTAADGPGVQVFVDRLRDEQQLANEHLVGYVDGGKLSRLRGRIEELAEAADRQRR